MKTTKRSWIVTKFSVLIVIVILIVVSFTVISITSSKSVNASTTTTIKASECKFEYVIVVCGRGSYGNIRYTDTFLVEHIQKNKYITTKEATEYVNDINPFEYFGCEFIPEQSSQCIIGSESDYE